MLDALFTGLHFKKVYIHSGTSCSQCVYQICRHLIWKLIGQIMMEVGICIWDRKYLNEYTPFWSVSLCIYTVMIFLVVFQTDRKSSIWAHRAVAHMGSINLVKIDQSPLIAHLVIHFYLPQSETSNPPVEFHLGVWTPKGDFFYKQTPPLPVKNDSSLNRNALGHRLSHSRVIKTPLAQGL